MKVSIRAGYLISGLLLLAPAGILHAQATGEPDKHPVAQFTVTGPTAEKSLDTYIITSDYQEKPCKVWVVLPDKFDKAKQYKVLYILPCEGAGDNEGIREARKLDLQNKYDIILVNPDFSRMPWYGDNPDNSKIRYESYLPDVIVPFVDKTFPTITQPQGRILIGFSKSGSGSICLLLKHPEMFGRAGAWDAPLNDDHTRVDWFGSQDNFKKNYYLPDLLARSADMLKTQPARIAITGLGWGGIESFHKQLDSIKVPHYCDETLTGVHEWKSGWLGPTVSVLMSDDMAKAKPVGHPTTKPAAP